MRQITILIATIFLVSCGTVNKTKQKAKETLYKKWELSVLDGNKIMSAQPVYIEFSLDNKVSGFIGCNRLTGAYTIENESHIKFSKLATTRMACRENEMALESRVLELLNTTDNFTLINGVLNLNIGRRAPLATFYARTGNEIVNKYWKLKVLDGQSIQITKNQEKEQYFTLRSDGTITGFSGCNQFNGQFKIDVGNRIRIHENLAVTMKSCPDLAIEEREFLKVFKLVDNYTIKGDTLSLNVGRRAPLAVFEAIYF